MYLRSGHIRIPFSAITETHEDQAWPEIVVQAFRFCKAWLDGDNTFSFRTSGSTGVPKLVTAERKQLEASAYGTIGALGLTAEDPILLNLDPKTVAGAMMLVRGLLTNAAITLIEPSVKVLEDLKPDHPYRFGSFVPMQLHTVIKQENAMAVLDRFNYVLVGGAAIDPALEKALEKSSASIFHTYGMTETFSHIALRRIGRDSLFNVLKGIEVRVDERGCLCIKGKVTKEEWVITNDLVTLHGDFSFEVLGRIDEVINSGGVKIFPEKLEKILRSLIPSRNLFVCGMPDERLGEKVVVVVEGEALDTKQIEEQLLFRITRYEKPRGWFFVDHFLQTGSGKTDKRGTLLRIDRQGFEN